MSRGKMEIKNKHVFITGANRGIGRAVALRLAEDKAHLHLVQRKFETEFEQELNTFQRYHDALNDDY